MRQLLLLAVLLADPSPYGGSPYHDYSLDGGGVFTGSVTLNDDVPLYWGTSNDATCEYDTAQTPDALVCSLSTDSLNWIIQDIADAGNDRGHALSTDPTLWLQASGATDAQYLSLMHNGTDAILATGAGDIRLNPAGSDINISAANLLLGAGYLDMAAIAEPGDPTSGTARMHTATLNGFTRLEYNNEGTQDIIIGRDIVIVVRNTSGASIAQGVPVYITGSTGNVPNVAPADSNSTTTLPAVGLMLDSAGDNNYGQVMLYGVLTGINTSAFASGAEVFVTPGGGGTLTATRPSAPNFQQRMGTVLVSGVGNGSLHVAPAPFIGGRETHTASAALTPATAGGTTLGTVALPWGASNFRLGATAQASIDAATTDRTSSAASALFLDVDFAADSTVGLEVDGNSTGDYTGLVSISSTARSGGMTTTGDNTVAFGARVSNVAGDAANTSVVGFNAVVLSDGGGNANLIGYGVVTGFDVALQSQSGTVNFLDYNATIQTVNSAGNAENLRLAAADAVTSGTGGSILLDAGAGAGGGANGVIIIADPIVSDDAAATSLTLQNQTFTPGALHSAVQLSPTWAAENQAHRAETMTFTQNGANSSSLSGLVLSPVKATAATTLGTLNYVVLSAPSVVGTVTNTYGISINDISPTGATTAFGIRVADLTSNGTTRAVELVGTGLEDGIRFGSDATLYGDGTNLVLNGGNLDLTPVSTQHLSLPLSNDAATPTLAFGDGDTGIWEGSDDVLMITQAGSPTIGFKLDGIAGAETAMGDFVADNTFTVDHNSIIALLVRKGEAAGNVFAIDTISNIVSLPQSGSQIVIASDVNITHSSNLLTIAGGSLLVNGDLTSAETSANIATTATTFAVPGTGNVIVLTCDDAATTLTTITGGTNGQIITLLINEASDVITVTDDNSGAANTINISAAFASTNNDTLTLVRRNGSWYEVSRAIN